ncbi:hypothetical protein Tco_1561709 [Tanacetum coccineum]
MASSRIYIPGVIRVACGNKVGRSVLLPASSSSHPLSSSSSLSAWYSAGILLGLLIVPNPAPLDQTRHQAMGGGDIAVPCYLGPRYKSGDGGTIKASKCLLAWMGWNADIEGRGLGELYTYDKMFLLKKLKLVVDYLK